MNTMLRNGLGLPVVLLIAWNAADVTAQSNHEQYHGHSYERRARGTDYIPYGYGFGFGYGPSTSAESYLRGRADLIRAYGQANYYNSAAQVYWEQARAKNIENRTARVQQFFDLRALNQQERFAQIAKSRLSKEQLVAVSKKAAPARLEEQDWNVATGGLSWPAALQGEAFGAERIRVDELFRQRRLLSSGAPNVTSAEVDQLTRQMADTLKGRISAVSPADYVAAKRFLSSVAQEARFDFAAGERLAGR